jgi:hypothetical protein
MVLPNAYGPDPSGLRLHPLRSSWLPWRRFHARRHTLGGAIGAPEVPIERLVGSTGCRLKSFLVRKPFPPLEPIGWPFVPRPWDGWGSKQRPRPDDVRSSLPAARWWYRGCFSATSTPHPPIRWRVQAKCPKARPLHPCSDWP